MGQEKEEKSPLWKRAVDRAVGAEHKNLPLGSRILKRLPGGEFAQAQLDRIEHRLMAELKTRLDRLHGEQTLSVLAFSVETPAEAETPERRQREAGEHLRRLLEASAEQSREQAEAAYYAMLVRNLLPDEARILSALSDHSIHPLVHVMSASMLGTGAVAVLENASSVGRSAGVLWPEMTRGYVTRLLAAGLAETGVEDESQLTKYEILETEDAVRAALEQVRARGQRAQIRRRTLHISALGHRLWEACRISED